eukprot:TRINITY_DN3581_c0_g1_i1.p1 TRINITY_DN3581_c0_g1~~TRINITY_DN3581_c0_g1_i1.p1  ORF type:complete len:312 (-),score=47.83 TRINITY_DN3581_c0_g1_i1:94-1029(-)
MLVSQLAQYDYALPLGNGCSQQMELKQPVPSRPSFTQQIPDNEMERHPKLADERVTMMRTSSPPIAIQSRKRSPPTFVEKNSQSMPNMFFLTFLQAARSCEQSMCQNTAFQKYMSLYMRNWEVTHEKLFSKNLIRREKATYASFKQHHPKLNREEWTWFVSGIKKLLTYEPLLECFQNSVPLQQFYQTCCATSVRLQKVSGNTNGLLARALTQQVFSSSNTPSIGALGTRDLQCLFVNYLCLYFPNFTELWTTSANVNNGKTSASCPLSQLSLELQRELENSFLLNFPVIDAQVMNVAFSCCSLTSDEDDY